MRQLLWLSLIPFTAFWLFSIDIYGFEISNVYSALSILLGLAISIIASRDEEVIIDRRYIVAVLPLAISSFIIPYPYNTGLIVVALALTVFLLGPKFKTVGIGALFSGIILTSQAFILPLYYIIASSFHQLGWLSFVISLLSNLTGLETSSSNGMVFVSGQGSIFPFTITLEKLGIYPWILIFVGAVVLILLASPSISASVKPILGIFLISIIYLLARYLLLINIFFATDLPEIAKGRMEIYTDPFWLLASFIPLYLLFFMAYIIPKSKLYLKLEIDRRHIIAYSLIFISVFCLTGAAIFQDPGIKKDGRVLVDEIHSVWEFSTLKLDKEWYGDNSTYNAYCMVEWLNDSYDVDRVVSPSYRDWNVSWATKVEAEIVSERLTYDLLKNYDILIIKTPSRYATEEADAIEQFVKEGGGLFLIGDHTNYDGTSTNLNQIAKKFGLEFCFDSVNTIKGRLYSYERGLLPHPCVKYTQSLDFMTGCSLTTSLDTEPVILGFGLEAEPGEYASSGFFRETRMMDPTRITDTTFGPINQAAAKKYGKGRVVAFPDSTIISNFRIFFGGTPNFVIGSMEYLNHKNLFNNGRQILLLLGLLILSFAIYILVKANAWGEKRLATLVAAITLAALSVSSGMIILSIETGNTIPSQFYDRNHTVCFDGQHSTQIVNQNDKMGDYSTFFIWTQRVGLTPSIEDNLEDAIEKGRTLVIIDPVNRISQEDSVSILDYVWNGNSVLLMVNSKGQASDLIKSFGLDTFIIKTPSNQRENATPINKSLPIKPWGSAIKGGNPLLRMNGRVVLAETSYGTGKFLLFTDSQVFKDGFEGRPGYMGYSKTDPNGMENIEYDLMDLYRLEYYILDAAFFKGDINDTLPYRHS